MPRRIHVAREPDSDEDEALAVARTEQRGQVAMFTWPTPREYFLELADRHAEKAFIPTDINREMLLDIFMDVMTCMNHSEKLTGILIAKEPHKRWKPNGTEREMHYHIAFKMKEDFAHRGIEHQMRERGVRGFISKSMKGWLQYAEYLLCETPKKPAHCRDPNPLLWPNPSGQALEQLRFLIKEGQKRTAELNAEVRGVPPRANNRKRRCLEWSEVISIVVENNIQEEADWWLCAKKFQTDNGENLMFNYYDRVRGRPQGMQRAIDDAWKIHKASNGETFYTGHILQTKCKYPIETFIVTEEMQEWVSKLHQTKSLVLHGPGGIGKTQLAQALLLQVCPKFFLCDSFEQTNKCNWTGREGILFDDVTLSAFGIDEAKALLDVEQSRAVKCRYEDGMLPAGAPRIYSTNHQRISFYPRDYTTTEHQYPIDRRVLWIEVTRCIKPNMDDAADDALPPPPPSEEDNIRDALLQMDRQAEEDMMLDMLRREEDNREAMAEMDRLDEEDRRKERLRRESKAKGSMNEAESREDEVRRSVIQKGSINEAESREDEVQRSVSQQAHLALVPTITTRPQRPKCLPIEDGKLALQDDLEGRKQLALIDGRKQMAIEDRKRHMAIEDKRKQLAIEDRRQLLAIEDRKTQLAIKDRRKQLAIKDKKTSKKDSKKDQMASGVSANVALRYVLAGMRELSRLAREDPEESSKNHMVHILPRKRRLRGKQARPLAYML